MRLTEEQNLIREAARQFARKEILPFAKEWEATGVPRQCLKKMGDNGLLGICVSQDWGGAGADFVSYVVAMEEISAADGGIANLMAANNSPVCAAIESSGTKKQKQRFLRALATGEMMGSIHLTEPHAGSDAASIRTIARRSGAEYVLTGQKAFITGGATSDVAIIVAVTDPESGKRGISCFLTPTDNPGYKVIRKEKKLGHRTNDTCAIYFDEMRIPETDLLGEEGRGLGIALSGLSAGRIGVAAQAVGGARAAHEIALDYARQREAFGKPIVEHQAIAFKLSEMATQIEAARQLYLHAAIVHDSGEKSLKQASMAKLFASEVAEKIASSAIQILGGYGYLEDYLVEKIFRDVRVYKIYEGTSDIQKIVISRHLLSEN